MLLKYYLLMISVVLVPSILTSREIYPVWANMTKQKQIKEINNNFLKQAYIIWSCFKEDIVLLIIINIVFLIILIIN